MSVPTHNLYDFIHQATKSQYRVKYFFPWGSKDLKNVCTMFESEYADSGKYIKIAESEFKETCFVKKHLPIQFFDHFNWIQFQPVLFCHDQEPLNFALYNDKNIEDLYITRCNKHYDKKIKNFNLRFQQSLSYQKYWILLHSELNSKELELYEQTNMFKGAYWWSHAVIARDWYRFAEHDKRLDNKNLQNLFLVYSRDVTGSRLYRQNFKNILYQEQIDSFCNFGDNDSNSNSSATYNYKDITTTGIHIILETVCDQRIHLTEKTLRPIACGQPFILANGPGSLIYLKKYGFKTFSPWIDESYDLESDSEKRLILIAQEMKRLSQLSESDRKYILSKCNQVALYNKSLFFSEEFFRLLTQELVHNVSKASLFTKNTLDWKLLWYNHIRKKLKDPTENWQLRRSGVLHLIKHLKKGGTLDDYVPPDSN